MSARIWSFGDDVDTDQIVPGRYAPYMRPDEDVANFAFVEARPDFAAGARPGDIVVAGRNFGCGSSREYAVEALVRRRLGAVVAASFARIFYRNAVNLGLPLFVSPEAAALARDGDPAELDVAGGRLVLPAAEIALPSPPPFVLEILEAGGIAAYVRATGRFPGTAG
jgi:methanogen homoaconitase small subunit